MLSILVDGYIKEIFHEKRGCEQPALIYLPYRHGADFGWPVGFAAPIEYDTILAEEPPLEPIRGDNEIKTEKPLENYLKINIFN